MIYKEEHLEALLSFFSENTPHPRQPFEQTRKILKRLCLDLEQEITANLAERRGDRAQAYLNYVSDELLQPNYYEYGQLAIGLLGDDPEVEPTAANLEYWKRKNVKREHLYHETDSDQVKRKKLKGMVRLAHFFGDKLEDLIYFAEERYAVGFERLQSDQEKDGLSSELARVQEPTYIQTLDHRISADVPLEIRYMKMKLQIIPLATDNMKYEIEDNWYDFETGISRPYLQLLHDRFRKDLEEARHLPAPYGQFPAEVEEAEIWKQAEWPELKRLLEEVQALRLSSLEEVLRKLSKQLESFEPPADMISRRKLPLTEHQDFLYGIMCGHAIERFDNPEFTSNGLVLYYKAPVPEILQKIERLRAPELMSEQEAADFLFAQERAKSSVNRYRWYNEKADSPDNFTPVLDPLKELEKFLKAYTTWQAGRWGSAVAP